MDGLLVTNAPITYSVTLNNVTTDQVWGSLYYALVGVPTSIDCRGKNVKAYYVPTSGNAVWCLIDNITVDKVHVDLVRPSTGNLNGVVYVEVI